MTHAHISKRFRGGKGVKGTAEYYGIVNDIIATFKQRWPSNYASIEPFLNDINTATKFFYSLLNGPVQSGKFLTANILMWILIVKHHYFVCYLSKNLDGVRTDALDKLHNGYITKLVDCHCEGLNLTSTEAASFKLETIAGLELGKEYKKVSRKAHKARVKKVAHKKPHRQEIPIFLMQHDNYEALIVYLKSVNKIRGSRCMIIVDEVHECYTDTNYDFLQGGLQHGSKNNSNRDMLHYLYNKCKMEGVTSLLGITATPERALVKDPLCTVEKIYTLVPDPPFKDAVYYGYIGTDLKNIIIEQREDSICDTVQEIINRDHTTTLHSKECKLVYICTETLSCKMENIHDSLVDQFGDSIYCKLLIGDTTRKTNDIPADIVVNSLAEFFNRDNLTDKICTTGTLVLIARKVLAASVTVKPDFNVLCERMVEGVCYRVNGITDQIVDVASSVEDHYQKSRLFGWYPQQHSSHYWVPSCYVSDATDGVAKTHEDLIAQFDPLQGVKSISTFTSSMTKVKKLCAGVCPYKSGQYGVHGIVIDTKPEGVELKVGIRFPNIDNTWDNNTLSDYAYVNKVTKSRRTELRNLLVDTTKHRQQIGWPQQKQKDVRYKGIVRSIVQPHFGDTKDSQRWQVNGFVTSRTGDPFDCKLNELITVEFEESYNCRKHWKHDSCQCDENLHIPHDTPIWFSLGGGKYYYFQMGKFMVHRHATAFENFKTDSQHTAVLNAMDTHATEIKETRPRFYDHFGKLAKMYIDKADEEEKWTTFKAKHYRALTKGQLETGIAISANVKLSVTECLDKIDHWLYTVFFKTRMTNEGKKQRRVLRKVALETRKALKVSLAKALKTRKVLKVQKV